MWSTDLFDFFLNNIAISLKLCIRDKLFIQVIQSRVEDFAVLLLYFQGQMDIFCLFNVLCTCIISINRLFHGSLDNWIIFVDFSVFRYYDDRLLCSIYRNCAFCVIRSRSSLRDSRLYGWVLLLDISCYCGGFVTRYIIPNIPIPT